METEKCQDSDLTTAQSGPKKLALMVAQDGPTSHQLGISFAVFLFSSQLGIRCVIHSSLERERGEGGGVIVVVVVRTVNFELLGIVSSNSFGEEKAEN